jgi:hypothetical protein
MLGACKKAESPAPASPQATPPTKETGPAPQAEIRPSAPKPSAGPTKDVVMRIKWPMGSRFVYRIDLDQRSTNKIPQMPKPIEQDMTMAMTYATTVVKETANGGHELEMEFLANEIEMKMGGQTMMSFDSKEPGQNDVQNPMVAPFRKMVGSKVRLQVDAEGKLDKVLNLDEWSQSLAGDQGPGRGMLGQQFNEAFFRQIIDSGRGLPSKPVNVGESWPFAMDVPAGPMGKIDLQAKITFQDWADRDQHHCAVLKTDGTIKGAAAPGPEPGAMMGAKLTVESGTITGTSWFDPELGALVDSESVQLMHIKGDLPPPPGGKQAGGNFTVDLSQKVTLKLVELTKAKP